MEYINPLKIKYPVVIRVTGLIGVWLVIMNFLVFPRLQNTLEVEDVDQIIIENIDIPQTQQIDNTPPTNCVVMITAARVKSLAQCSWFVLEYYGNRNRRIGRKYNVDTFSVDGMIEHCELPRLGIMMILEFND